MAYLILEYPNEPPYAIPVDENVVEECESYLRKIPPDTDKWRIVKDLTVDLTVKGRKIQCISDLYQ